MEEESLAQTMPILDADLPSPGIGSTVPAGMQHANQQIGIDYIRLRLVTA